MARIRSIHPCACTSEKLARTSSDEERCFWRLQTHCDDEGRAEDHARLICAALFPLNADVVPEDVDKWLQGLHDLGLILRYEVNGKRLLTVVGWKEKQSPRHPTPSKFPHPPECYGVLPQEYGQSCRGVGEGEGVEVRASAHPFEDDFVEWWSVYPRKIDKDPARKVYLARRRAGTTAVDLLSSAKHYGESVTDTAREHIKYPKTFLNGSWSEWVAGIPDEAQPERPATLEELATPRRLPGPWACSAGNPECVDGFVDTDVGAKSCACRGVTPFREVGNQKP